jgi:hypothetical protein
MKYDLQASTLFMKSMLCDSGRFGRYVLMNSYSFRPLEPEYTPCGIEIVYNESRQCR